LAVPYAGAGDLVYAAFVNQTSGTVHAESGVPYLSFWGGGTASGQAGVTTFRGDPGTALVFAGLRFDGSASIAADSVYLNGTSAVAGSYQATSLTAVSGAAIFTGTVGSVGALTVSTGSTVDFSPPAPVTLSATNVDVAGAVTGSGLPARHQPPPHHPGGGRTAEQQTWRVRGGRPRGAGTPPRPATPPPPPPPSP